MLNSVQREAREKILYYLESETRGGCFYLIGGHVSGKTYLLKQLAQEICGSNENILNLNFYVSQKVLQEPNYEKLAKFHSPKFKVLITNGLKELFRDKNNFSETVFRDRIIYLLFIDHLEILYEYDVNFIPLLDSLSVRKGWEKKVILSIPGKVSNQRIYAFGKTSYTIPKFSTQFWTELH